MMIKFPGTNVSMVRFKSQLTNKSVNVKLLNESCPLKIVGIRNLLYRTFEMPNS